MAERKAVIDLGTNTFNLLIAEVHPHGFEVIHTEKDGVALGMGGINKNQIAADAYERGLHTLRHFRTVCDKFGVAQPEALGTSALRDAMNGPEFVQQAKAETGIVIQIISGEEEAGLIYAGVSWSHPFHNAGLIMDIGGGSTEFILAGASGIAWKQSFNIGVARIYQELQLADPYGAQEVAMIEAWLEKHTHGFFEQVRCDELVGASGSFETFYEMIHHEAFQEHFQTIELPLNELFEVLDWLIYSTSEERNQHPYIIPIRRIMGPIAAVKTRWILKKIEAKRCFVTPCSLKEGVLRLNQQGLAQSGNV